MEAHDAAVRAITERVRTFHQSQRPFCVFHGSTNSTRKSQYLQDNTVDISGLNNVLKIEVQGKVALVEPNVPMDRLVQATLAKGLVPPVIMEFPGITVGGGFSGTSGESSSFRYGFFDKTVVSIEIVLGSGTVVTASSEQHSDLVFGAASAFGTLGIVTLVELKLIPAQPYVSMTYYPIYSASEAVRIFQQLQKDKSIDYLDGILFSKDRGVVMAGSLASDVQHLPVRSFSAPSDPWFYLHADKLLQRAAVTTEAVPLVDYLFRYDRGGFWVGKYAFQYFMTPFNLITRRLLNRFMHTRVMYHALHKSGHSELYIIQDVGVPYAAASELVEYLNASFGHYPLWLCPLLQTAVSPMSPRSITPRDETGEEDAAMLLNFGVWGPGPKRREQFVAFNRELERKVYDLGGKKSLYAHTYYSEDEFWSIYDRKRYDALRLKYSAVHLPTIYDKVKVDVAAERKAIESSWIAWILVVFWSIWPLSGIYGVFHTIFRTNYLMQRPKKELRRDKVD